MRKIFSFNVFIFLLLAAASSINAATTFCKWKDNKAGAWAMDFDDAMYTHVAYAIPQLVARGLAGNFQVVPGSIMYGYGIMMWESQCGRLGMQLSNHTMNHCSVSDMNTARYEFSEASRIIWSLNTPGKSKLLCCGISGAATYPPNYRSFYPEYYLTDVPGYNASGRLPGSLAEQIQSIQMAISSGTYRMFNMHGVGPQAEYLFTDRGWSTADFLSMLDYLVSVSSQLWVGGFQDTYMYSIERSSAVAAVVEDSTTAVRINLTSTGINPLLPDLSLYDYPLTLISDVPAGWAFCKIIQGNVISIKPVSSNQVMYEALPNREEIRLENCLAMDISPPAVPAVRDGTGADISITNDLYSISANWTAGTDAESGIKKYWYKVGSTPGGSEVFNWVDNGTFTYVTTSRTNVALSRGVTYYVSVIAVNGVGLESVPGVSDGQCAATIPWQVKFYDDFETGSLAKWNTSGQSATNILSVTTSAYQGTYGIKCQVLDKTSSILSKTSITPMGAKETFVKFNVKLENLSLPQFIHSGEGLDDADWPDKVLSIMKLTDESGGFLGSMFLGNDDTGINMYFEYLEGSDWVCAPGWPGKYAGYLPISTGTWHTIDIHTKADDNIKGGIEIWLDGVKVQSALRRPMTAAAKNLEIGVTSIGSNVTGNIYYDNVVVSESYYTPAAAAPPVDSTPPPAPASARDGLSSDVDSSTFLTQLSANWDASADAESGIAKYWYAIGTTAGAADITSWTDNGSALSVTKTGLTLANNQAYYFSVKAENGAGSLGAAANSNGQTVASNTSSTIGAGVTAYPNPCSFANNQPLKFVVNGPTGAELKLFTITGELVATLSAAPGATEINWFGKNSSAENVVSGIYIFKLTDASGTRKGKFAVLR